MCDGIIQELGGDVGVCAAEGNVDEDLVGTSPMQAIISISVSSSSSARGSASVSDDERNSVLCSIALSVTWPDSEASSSEGGGVRGESGSDSSSCASEGN